MVPVINKFSDELLSTSGKLDFLLPNGIIISLEPEPDVTLKALKSHLWLMAANAPFFDRLEAPSNYVFQGINEAAEEEEFYEEESFKFSSLILLFPFMRLEKIAEDSKVVAMKIRNAMISRCSTVCQAELENDAWDSGELAWARSSLLSIAEANAAQLKSGGSAAMARYLTAATQQPKLTVSLNRILVSLPALTVGAWILDSLDPPQQRLLTLELPKHVTVAGALQAIIDHQTQLISHQANDGNGSASHDFNAKLNPSDYLLKICCSQEYLFDSKSVLIYYTYVQNKLELGEIPKLSPVLLTDVLESLNLSTSTADGDNCDEFQQMSVKDNDMPPILPSILSLTAVDVADGAGDVSENLWSLTDYFAIIVRSAKFIDRLGDSSVVGDLNTINQNPLYLGGGGGGDIGMEVIVGNSMLTPQTDVSSYESLSADILSSESHTNSSASLSSMRDMLVECSDPPLTSLDVSWSSLVVPTTPASMDNKSRLSSSSQSGSYVVRVGLCQGGQLLMEYQNTRDASPQSLVWNQPLNFHLFYADLSLVTRVCVVLLKIKKRPSRTLEYPVGWATINLFDHNGFLITGKRTISLWRVNPLSTDPDSHQLNLSGTLAVNPDPEILLHLEFCNPCQNRRVRFPLDRFTKTITGEMAQNHQLLSGDGDCDSLVSCDADEEVVRCIKDLLTRDPFYELSEQDKAVLWRGRELCRRRYPTALPWLVQAVTWQRHEAVAEFYRLLAYWPRPLPVHVALALLGVAGLSCLSNWQAAENTTGAEMMGTVVGNTGVADPLVRDIAVQGLHAGLANADLADYLLQLVQVLRTEAHLTNTLTCFLLQRALACPNLIGLRLCWHLRAQIHQPDTRLRFGLILDAFCRGCGLFLNIINDQVVALQCLTNLAVAVKNLTDEEEQRAWFKSELAKSEVRHDLESITSPLRFSVKLGSIVESQCTVKRSKKRPLWIVWLNPDILSPHHHSTHQLLFKHGDDLRQDMLTLQLLKVMDRIWKDEGLNLNLTTYGCLATGDEIGLIEVVRNSQTIMSIQGQRVRSAMQIDSSQLHKWFLQKAGGDRRVYESAIQRFTNSCAGYCVATFVLGIRDRHNDNIMVDETGRLFHIDFGHILNNKKKKFGITRERVPFVLTSDFACVIARGEEKPYRSQGFIEFTKLCDSAYLVLRRHANLILTLFAMMLPSGLPELTCVSDLDYVRKTLAVEAVDEEEALNYFNAKFNEAYNGAWTTKIDWFAHWVRR